MTVAWRVQIGRATTFSSEKSEKEPVGAWGSLPPLR